MAPCWGGQLAGVDPQLRVFRGFVWVIDAGKVIQYALPGFLIEAFGVSLFADLDRRVHKNLHEEKACFVVYAAGYFAVFAIRGYEAGHGYETGGCSPHGLPLKSRGFC